MQKWCRKGRVFEPDTSLWWSRTHAQVPVVLDKGDTWRIYYSGRDDKGMSRIGYFDTAAGDPKKILFVAEEPLFELGQSSEFDEHGMMPTSVITSPCRKFNYLYYIGWQTAGEFPFENSVGLAVSDDEGKSFTKYGAPVLSKDAVDKHFVGTFCCLPVDNGYMGYYLSCFDWKKKNGKWEPYYDIKLARSVDGVQWNKDKKICIELKEGEGGIASASVVKDEDIFLMWYSVRGSESYREGSQNAYQLGFAQSNDGVDWQRRDNLITYDSKREWWESVMMAYPNVVRHENHLYLFYNGDGFGRTGIGYLTHELGS